MPELPEVETVKNTLKKIVLNKTIKDVIIYYDKIISYPLTEEFVKKIINQKINNIKRRGKFLMFELDDYYLLSHLRMEGRYYIKPLNDLKCNYELVNFKLNDMELRYIDTRKFGKMYLIKKDKIYNIKPLNSLGLEPWDLTIDYLKNKYKNIKTPIKTCLLDQSIITGIGNIYADEILFLSKINPYTKTNELNYNQISNIIKYTISVLDKAIKMGGTTIKTYESSEGVHGLFQQELLVHGKDICSICNTTITKEFINGRGTYYCKNCQKKD